MGSRRAKDSTSAQSPVHQLAPGISLVERIKRKEVQADLIRAELERPPTMILGRFGYPVPASRPTAASQRAKRDILSRLLLQIDELKAEYQRQTQLPSSAPHVAMPDSAQLPDGTPSVLPQESGEAKQKQAKYQELVVPLLQRAKAVREKDGRKTMSRDERVQIAEALDAAGFKPTGQLFEV